MTVGELKELLRGVPDNYEVTVRTEDDEGNFYCGTVSTAKMDVGCDDENFFAIDCEPPAMQEMDGVG